MSTSENSSLGMGNDDNSKYRLNRNDSQIISNKRNYLNHLEHHHFHLHNHNNTNISNNAHRIKAATATIATKTNELNIADKLLFSNATINPTVLPATALVTLNSSTESTGQLALDRLLESLAIESDIMEQQLAQINGNGLIDRNTNDRTIGKDAIFTYPTVHDKNMNTSGMQMSAQYANNKGNNKSNITNTTNDQNDCASSSGIHSNLNDVIANLTEFTRNETMRQLNLVNGNTSPSSTSTIHTTASNNNHHLNNNNNYHLHNTHNNHHHINHINGNRYYQEPIIAVKRLTSESENSSSISPSLSERSNGVSWSDQVRSNNYT